MKQGREPIPERLARAAVDKEEGHTCSVHPIELAHSLSSLFGNQPLEERPAVGIDGVAQGELGKRAVHLPGSGKHTLRGTGQEVGVKETCLKPALVRLHL
ncbi:hypothetical protein ES703_112884 [subsurface metagenome]